MAEPARVPDDATLRRFLTPDGRLHTIPRRHAKLRVVLDHLAQSFQPERVYAERDVNAVLEHSHPDYAALRRYLVDDGFLTREDAHYWRSGGTFEV